jgi:hypothetical protein
MSRNVDANDDSPIGGAAFRRPSREIVGGESNVAAGLDSPRVATFEHDSAAARCCPTIPFEGKQRRVFGSVLPTFLCIEEAVT